MCGTLWARIGHADPYRLGGNEPRVAGRSGFGSVRKLPAGRWQARFLGPDMVRHVGATTFQTKVDAQAWLAEERRLITLGNARHPTNVL